MTFENIVKYGRENGKFHEFKQGDTNRYPHLNLRLDYDPATDCFISSDVAHNVNELLKKDLLIRELMVPSASKLFVKDLLQVKYSWAEKYESLEDVGKFVPPPFTVETIYPEGFGWNKSLPLHLVTVESPHIFPIGVVVKGTDIAIIDQHSATRGQEIGHAIYHYKEGISTGAENITEVHGDPFYLYALQCLEGRLARRIRTGSSPHRIKFPDYVCLRALVGTKIVPGTYHAALGLLAPPMSLVSTLVGESVLISALFDGSSAEIEKAVNEYLGAGAYDEIFMSFDVFGRLDKIRARKPEAVDRMFDHPLFPSEIDKDQVRRYWEHTETRAELDSVLV